MQLYFRGPEISHIDKPDDAERYACSVGHGRLSGASLDAVGAAGMVWPRHRLGLLLQRLRAAPDIHDVAEARRILLGRTREALDRRLVRRDGQRTEAVVTQALGWWLAPPRPRDRPGARPEGQLAAWVCAYIERCVADSEDRLHLAR